MSKFFKALEQAKRDRALASVAIGAAVRAADGRLPAGPAADTAPAPRPMTESVDDVDEHLVSLVTPAAFEAEQYRALRHIVEQMHRTATLKVLAVSSPGMGDGKTITAINLAGALAQSPEARVLLVDADLRRPALGRLLGLGDAENANLVAGILDPALLLSQIARSRPPFNLSVICAGQTPPSPYEILKSPRLGKLLDEARQQYDYIILDTPPLHPVQDCRVIGRWVDGFILVVTAHRTPRRLVEEALTTLDPAKVLGFVFNGAEHPISGYYSGYYYRNEYSADQPFANGHGSGTLRRAVRRVGALLRHNKFPKPASRRQHGDQE